MSCTNEKISRMALEKFNCNKKDFIGQDFMSPYWS